MRIYLDVSCLNRPFDDQRQARIRLEAEAVMIVLEQIESGLWRHVTSRLTVLEVNANADAARRNRVQQMLPMDIMSVSTAMRHRAEELMIRGLGSADAIHVAAAEQLADVFLTCDDRLLKRCRQLADELNVRVENPAIFVKEQTDAADA